MHVYMHVYLSVVDCGPPPLVPGSVFDGFNPDDPRAFKVGSQFGFSCRQPYKLIGNSSLGDFVVRCLSSGIWDFGDLRCEGKVPSYI